MIAAVGSYVVAVDVIVAYWIVDDDSDADNLIGNGPFETERC